MEFGETGKYIHVSQENMITRTDQKPSLERKKKSKELTGQEVIAETIALQTFEKIEKSKSAPRQKFEATQEILKNVKRKKVIIGIKKLLNKLPGSPFKESLDRYNKIQQKGKRLEKKFKIQQWSDPKMLYRNQVQGYKQKNVTQIMEMEVNQPWDPKTSEEHNIRSFYEASKKKDYVPRRIDEGRVRRMRLNENFAPPPKQTNEFSKTETENFHVATSSLQGKRPTMEDSHYVGDVKINAERENEKNIEVFAVFDGHGGQEVANFCKENLPEFLKIMLQDVDLSDDEKVFYALKGTTVALSEAFKEAHPEKTLVGTTANINLMIGGFRYTVNVGDSRSISSERQVLSEDQKPNTPAIAQVVESRQGTIEQKKDKDGNVISERVAVPGTPGGLAIGRTIGPMAGRDGLVANAKVTRGKDDAKWYLSACDGLWDVVSPAEVEAFINDVIQKNPEDPEKIIEIVSQGCAKLAAEKGRDNVTVVFALKKPTRE